MKTYLFIQNETVNLLKDKQLALLNFQENVFVSVCVCLVLFAF